MREIEKEVIINTIKEMVISSNTEIPGDVLKFLNDSKNKEKSPIGKTVLEQIIESDTLSHTSKIPMCQDTGVVVIFLEIGYDLHFDYDIYETINEGIRRGYIDGYLRKSIVGHPLNRINTKDNTPGIIHTKLVSGDKLKISLMTKGGGAENMSVIKMLLPDDGVNGIKQFVLDTVMKAGGKACPPIVVGVGIGGNLEKSALLAKEALLRDLADTSDDPIISSLETDILNSINKLGIGPMGFGGTTTALSVKINTYPCHIASLPVSINIQCHSQRHKVVIL